MIFESSWSPGSRHVSPRPRVALALPSPRPPVDRCQAILDDFLAPLGAKRSKCDFEQPSIVLGCFCSPRGGQVAPFGLLCGPLAPLGAPKWPSRGSVFRSQRHFGCQTCQSVILSTPPMVFDGFCAPKGCFRGAFRLGLGLPGHTWAPQVTNFWSSKR